MNFAFKVDEVFNILGRGTVLAGTFQGQLKTGEKLLTESGEEIHVSGIEMTRPGDRMGIVVRYDYVKARGLIGKTLTKN